MHHGISDFLHQMAKLPLRVLRPNDFLSWRWMVSCLAVAVIVTLFISYRDLRRPWRKVKAHLRARRFRREFWMDMQYMGFKAIFDPVKLIFLGGAFLKLSVSTESHVRAWLQNKAMLEPSIHLNEYVGPFAAALFAVLIWDFGGYVHHYICHYWAPAWEFHKSHHRSTYLTPLTKWRLHPLSEIFYNLVSGLIVGTGMAVYNTFVVSWAETPWVTALEFSILTNYLLAHLRHTHFWLSFGWFNYVLQSPAMHQIHHSRNPEHYGKNIGVVFSIWDYAFGTLYLPKMKREPLRFGLSEPLPVKSHVFLYEMIEPFIGLAKLFRDRKRAKVEPAPAPSRAAEPWRQSGMSLMEVVVAVPIAMIVAAGAVWLITSFFAMTKTLSEDIETDANLSMIVNNMRLITRSAINVAYRTGDLSGQSSAADGKGYVREFNYERFTDLTAASTPLMFFARENSFSSVSGNNTLVGSPRATAVFFVPPKKGTPGGANLPASGEIRIALGGADKANETLGPANAQLILSGVVGLSLYSASYDKNLVMKSIMMAIKLRSFLPNPKVGGGYLWCPEADIASCPGMAPYRDYESSVVLQFDNNRRTVLDSSNEFPFGVYFFKSAGGF